MGVHPHPHHRHQPLGIDSPFRGQEQHAHGHETEEQRPLDPAAVGADHDHGNQDQEPADERAGGPSQRPHEGAHRRGRQPDEEQHARRTPPAVRGAVEERRQPTLYDPALAGRGERVRIAVGMWCVAHMIRPVARWVRKLLSLSGPSPINSDTSATIPPTTAARRAARRSPSKTFGTFYRC